MDIIDVSFTRPCRRMLMIVSDGISERIWGTWITSLSCITTAACNSINICHRHINLRWSFFTTFTQLKYLGPINYFKEWKHPTIWKDHRYAASLQALKESNWSKPVPPGHQAECGVSHKIAIIPSVVFMHVFRTEMILEKMWFRSTLWVKDFKLICFYMQPRFEIWTTVPVEPANLPYRCKLSEWWCLFHYADLAKNFWLWPSSRH